MNLWSAQGISRFTLSGDANNYPSVAQNCSDYWFCCQFSYKVGRTRESSKVGWKVSINNWFSQWLKIVCVQYQITRWRFCHNTPLLPIFYFITGHKVEKVKFPLPPSPSKQGTALCYKYQSSCCMTHQSIKVQLTFCDTLLKKKRRTLRTYNRADTEV